VRQRGCRYRLIGISFDMALKFTRQGQGHTTSCRSCDDNLGHFNEEDGGCKWKDKVDLYAVIAGKEVKCVPDGHLPPVERIGSTVKILVSRWTCKHLSKLMAQTTLCMPHDASRGRSAVQTSSSMLEQDTEQWTRTRKQR
jgi:hypothetical protein